MRKRELRTMKKGERTTLVVKVSRIQARLLVRL